jgi:hypothetical protein
VPEPQTAMRNTRNILRLSLGESLNAAPSGEDRALLIGPLGSERLEVLVRGGMPRTVGSQSPAV